VCGIIGAYINHMDISVMKNLYEIFLYQARRGLKGAGISINNTDLFRFRSVSPYRLFNVYNLDVWQRIKSGDRVLVHHRYPTSSPNAIKFNHPIANEKKDIHIIHNGVLYNYHELYEELKKNHKFETEHGKEYTDSEVIMHSFEDGLKKNDGNMKKALIYVYKKVSGSFAVAINIKGDKNIYLIRHSNPIIISKDSNGNHYFSSELNKDNKNLEFVYELKEGEIGKLTKDGYKKITLFEPVSYQSKVVHYGRNRPSFEVDEMIETVNLGDDIETFILVTRDDLRFERPDMSYSKLCLHIFSALDNEFPEINIENADIRNAIREVIDEK